MSEVNRVLMVAAENDALPGAKVGGVGDVIRDLPEALVKEGVQVDTVIPSYGFLARIDNLEYVGNITIKFASKLHDIRVLKRQGLSSEICHYILDHPEFSKAGETVYNDDVGDRPFASDGTKFAFFSTCVAQAIMQGAIPRPDVLHCHDWHTAYLLVLIAFGYEYVALRDIKSVFTIHNLAMQGIRPFQGDPSSFSSWFPDLRYSIDKVVDPRYSDCMNAMRAGILLAKRVHTVSPSYAKEILQHSNHELGIYGGDGLEHDLRQRTDRGQVVGILNGCHYVEDAEPKPLSKADLVHLMHSCVLRWAARARVLSSAHWIAEKRIAHWSKSKSTKFVVTSVGRVTEQKIRVLQTPVEGGKTALSALLERLGDNGVLILLGSGDAVIETFLAEASAVHKNFIFLNGYSDELSKALYEFGDLFLMPSSFEPCGISQMLAMRVGQPCLVNAVGGLKDTVKHNETGYVFSGGTVFEQADALVDCFAETMHIFFKEPDQWKAVAKRAAEQRFSWESSAKSYMNDLYSID